MTPPFDKRNDDKLQNLILDRLGVIEKKVDSSHILQESMLKTCLARKFELKETKEKINNHVAWHTAKKKKMDRFKEAMLLSTFGTILYLARDKISNILELIFK